MSVRTKSMTHIKKAFDGFIELESKAEGLADTLYTGVRELVNECGIEDALEAFQSACKDLEKDFETETLPQTWRSRKSEISRGLKLKLDPNKFASFSKYRKASKEAANPTVSTTEGYTPHDNKGGVDGGTTSKAKVSEVTSNMPSKVRDKLNKVLAALNKLPEDEALAVLKNCNNAIHAKLHKLGGRFGNVKATGS